MTPNRFLHGPAACGKTRNADRIARALGLTTVCDEADSGRVTTIRAKFHINRDREAGGAGVLFVGIAMPDCLSGIATPIAYQEAIALAEQHEQQNAGASQAIQLRKFSM